MGDFFLVAGDGWLILSNYGRCAKFSERAAGVIYMIVVVDVMSNWDLVLRIPRSYSPIFF